MSAAKPAQPIRLHTTLLSGHGHRVKLFLTLLDLPFEVIELDMAAGDNRRPEYLKLNPFGQVPTIEDGDTVLFDSNAILVYLAKRYGDAVMAARRRAWRRRRATLALARGRTDCLRAVCRPAGHGIRRAPQSRHRAEDRPRNCSTCSTRNLPANHSLQETT